MSFFSAFTGKAQKRDIEAANAQSNAALAQGYADYNTNMDKASGFYDKAYGQYDQLNPWVQGGAKAQGMYADALGVNGQGAAQGANSVYFDSPVWQQINDRSQNALMRYQNSRGGIGSGAALAAGSNTAYQNYGNWLNQLQGLGSQGGQYATQQVQGRVGALQGQAGLSQDRAQTAYGYGGTRAGQAINYGNAMAQTRGIGVNNLMGLVAPAMKAYTASLGVPPTPGGG